MNVKTLLASAALATATFGIAAHAESDNPTIQARQQAMKTIGQNFKIVGDTAKGTKKVKCDGKTVALSSSNFSTSSGDEAGNSPGGVVSGKYKGKAEFVNFSFDVKFEGKNVERALDEPQLAG